MQPTAQPARKTPVFTDASPAATLDFSKLPSTRFIAAAERKYPFRDALGRINLHLVNSSLAEAEVDGDVPSCERLRTWQRHAVRNLATRPADERMTLDELADEESSDAEAEEPSAPKSCPATVPGMRRRLFREPRDGDEPSFSPPSSPSSPSSMGADRLHLCLTHEEGAGKREKTERRRATRAHAHARAASERSTSGSAHDSSDADSDSDEGEDGGVWEVERVLDEDELGGRGFLIRWAGFSAEHDTWEPEWNLAPHLVTDFRKERALARRNAGDDYHLGRTRMLWCAACRVHMAADSFSANMRKAAPGARTCLVHHYNKSDARAPAAAAAAAATTTPVRASTAASAAASRVASGSRKRPRGSDERSPAHSTLPAPPAPHKAARPVARALSHRQAALEMRTSRLFGFGAI